MLFYYWLRREATKASVRRLRRRFLFVMVVDFVESAHHAFCDELALDVDSVFFDCSIDGATVASKGFLVPFSFESKH